MFLIRGRRRATLLVRQQKAKGFLSIDFYLFHIAQGQTVEDAAARINELTARVAAGSGSPDHHLPVADVIIAHDDRFSLAEYYFCDLLTDNTVAHADRPCFKYFELNGPDDLCMAQIVIHANHFVIHYYSGTSEDDLQEYFRLICRETNYSVFDPQADEIYRYVDG